MSGRSKFQDRAYWIDVADRAVSSFAQGILGSATLDSTGILDIGWTGVLSLAGSYALLSICTSVAARGNSGSAS